MEENFNMLNCPIAPEFWLELRKKNLLPEEAPVPVP